MFITPYLNDCCSPFLNNYKPESKIDCVCKKQEQEE